MEHLLLISADRRESNLSLVVGEKNESLSFDGIWDTNIDQAVIRQNLLPRLSCM